MQVKFHPTAQNLNRRRLYGRPPTEIAGPRERALSRITVSQDAAANLAIFSANFAPCNHVIYASATLLFRWRFLINDLDQNFVNQPTAPCGYGYFSFRPNCASASCIVLNRPFHAKLRWW